MKAGDIARLIIEPSGIASVPIAVALALSLSPNHNVVTLAAEFKKKGYVMAIKT